MCPEVGAELRPGRRANRVRKEGEPARGRMACPCRPCRGAVHLGSLARSSRPPLAPGAGCELIERVPLEGALGLWEGEEGEAVRAAGRSLVVQRRAVGHHLSAILGATARGNIHHRPMQPLPQRGVRRARRVRVDKYQRVQLLPWRRARTPSSRNADVCRRKRLYRAMSYVSRCECVGPSVACAATALAAPRRATSARARVQAERARLSQAGAPYLRPPLGPLAPRARPPPLPCPAAAPR